MKKGGVFALNDDMKQKMYGDMEGLRKKLRDMGYEEVRLVDTAQEAFGSHRRAAMMMLGLPGCLSAESNVSKRRFGYVQVRGRWRIPCLSLCWERIYASEHCPKFLYDKRRWN